MCYWAVHEMGLTASELARRLRLTQPAVSYAVSRGEQLARKRNYNLVSQFIYGCTFYIFCLISVCLIGRFTG
jgi:DNA-binding transcriptional ArsR family regulator